MVITEEVRLAARQIRKTQQRFPETQSVCRVRSIRITQGGHTAFDVITITADCIATLHEVIVYPIPTSCARGDHRMDNFHPVGAQPSEMTQYERKSLPSLIAMCRE